MNKHPKFFILDVNDQTEGMDFNSLVDLPAHMKEFIAMSKDGEVIEPVFEYKFNEEKRIVTGVAIATYLPIKRFDKEIGEHYVIFTEESANRVWSKMMMSGYLNNVNEMHDSNKVLKGMTLLEAYSIDKSGGVYPEKFSHQNLKKGSKIVSYHVDNDEAWENIKMKKVRGFSIEGWFAKIPLKMKGEFRNQMKINMAKLSQVNTWEIEIMEDAIEFDQIVHIAWMKEDGSMQDGGKLQSGEYLTPDGKKIMIDSVGKVVMIDGKTKEQMSNENHNKMKKPVKSPGLMKRLFGKDKFESVTTADGLVLSWEGELKEGTEVYAPKAVGEGETPSDEKVLAPEGDHAIPMGEGKMKVITIDGNGKVTAITEVDEANQSAEEVEQAMKKIIADNKTAMAKLETDYKTELKKLQEDQVKEIKKLQDTFTAKTEELMGMIREMAAEIDTLGEGESRKKFSGADTKSGYRKLLEQGAKKA